MALNADSKRIVTIGPRHEVIAPPGVKYISQHRCLQKEDVSILGQILETAMQFLKDGEMTRGADSFTTIRSIAYVQFKEFKTLSTAVVV